MAVELSPSVLESLGLVPTLEQLMHEKFKDSAVETHLETKGDEKERFSHSFEITVYRVIEEAFNNILNNAQAENVHLSFTLDNDSLMVMVKDDGVGFDVEKLFAGDPNNYLGLFGMHEMVTLIGGELSFSSSPGEGTVVQIKLIRNHPIRSHLK